MIPTRRQRLIDWLWKHQGVIAPAVVVTAWILLALGVLALAGGFVWLLAIAF